MSSKLNGMENKKCRLCQCENMDPNNDVIPGITFNWLEGNPFICELCFLRQLGFEGTWKEEVTKYIKEHSHA